MSRIDPDRAHRIAAELVARVRADHPEHENEVWGELLIELLAGGLCGQPEAAAAFAASVNYALACMARQRGGGNSPWQLVMVTFTPPPDEAAGTLH